MSSGFNSLQIRQWKLFALGKALGLETRCSGKHHFGSSPTASSTGVPMNLTVLIGFKCPCSYHEDIGIGTSTGVIIRGSITLVCPACGNILVVDNVCAVTPVRFPGARVCPPPQAPPVPPA